MCGMESQKVSHTGIHADSKCRLKGMNVVIYEIIQKMYEVTKNAVSVEGEKCTSATYMHM